MKCLEALGVGDGSIINLWLCSFDFKRVVDLFPYLGLIYLPAEKVTAAPSLSAPVVLEKETAQTMGAIPSARVAGRVFMENE